MSEGIMTDRQLDEIASAAVVGKAAAERRVAEIAKERDSLRKANAALAEALVGLINMWGDIKLLGWSKDAQTRRAELWAKAEEALRLHAEAK